MLSNFSAEFDGITSIALHKKFAARAPSRSVEPLATLQPVAGALKHLAWSAPNRPSSGDPPRWTDPDGLDGISTLRSEPPFASVQAPERSIRGWTDPDGLDGVSAPIARAPSASLRATPLKSGPTRGGRAGWTDPDGLDGLATISLGKRDDLHTSSLVSSPPSASPSRAHPPFRRPTPVPLATPPSASFVAPPVAPLPSSPAHAPVVIAAPPLPADDALIEALSFVESDEPATEYFSFEQPKHAPATPALLKAAPSMSLGPVSSSRSIGPEDDGATEFFVEPPEADAEFAKTQLFQKEDAAFSLDEGDAPVATYSPPSPSPSSSPRSPTGPLLAASLAALLLVLLGGTAFLAWLAFRPSDPLPAPPPAEPLALRAPAQRPTSSVDQSAPIDVLASASPTIPVQPGVPTALLPSAGPLSSGSPSPAPTPSGGGAPAHSGSPSSTQAPSGSGASSRARPEPLVIPFAMNETRFSSRDPRGVAALEWAQRCAGEITVLGSSCTLGAAELQAIVAQDRADGVSAILEKRGHRARAHAASPQLSSLEGRELRRVILTCGVQP